MTSKATTTSAGRGKPKLLTGEILLPEMISIPEGDLIVGTSDEQVQELLRVEEWATEWFSKDMFQAEQPQHLIFVYEFEMAKTPLTNIEYHNFVWATNYRVPKGWAGFTFPDGMNDHPVVDISQEDANAYCKWLNSKTGSNYRLPTELEWERAARGDDDRMYPWGKEFDPWRCNTVESGKRGTTPVKNYVPGGDSPYGVTDMGGNVWEWTSTAFRPYPYDPDDGREKPGSEDKITVRGGAWYYSKKLARCTAREGVLVTYTSSALGFRLARTPKK